MILYENRIMNILLKLPILNLQKTYLSSDFNTSFNANRMTIRYMEINHLEKYCTYQYYGRPVRLILFYMLKIQH